MFINEKVSDYDLSYITAVVSNETVDSACKTHCKTLQLSVKFDVSGFFF